MSGKSMAGVVIALLLVVLASNSLFIIKETDRAVLLRFGEIVNLTCSQVCILRFL